MKRKLLSIAISLMMICSIFTGFTVNSEATDNSNQTFAVKYVDAHNAIFSNKPDTVKYGDSFTTTVSCLDYEEIISIAVTMGKDKCIEPTVNPDGSCVIDIPFVTGDITIGVTLNGKEPPHIMVGNGTVASITTSLDHLTFYKQYDTDKYLIEETVEEFSCSPYDLVVIPEDGYEIDTLKVIYNYKDLKSGEYTKEEKPLEKMDDGSYVLSHGYHEGNMHLEGVVKPVETDTSSSTADTSIIKTEPSSSSTETSTITTEPQPTVPQDINVTSVTLNAAKKVLNVGKTAVLKATVTPKNATNKRIVWSTSNKKVVAVNSKGVIKGIRKGTANVYAKAADGSKKYARCTVTVKQPVTRVKLSLTKKTLKARQSCRIMAVAYPGNANNRYVEWTTSNKKVAYVTKNKTKSNTWNYIKAKKKGTAVIKAIAVDGSKKSASCKVTVKK